MFVDSHCHLNLLDLVRLKLTLPEVIQDAIQNKVNSLLTVATHINQHNDLIAIAKQFPMVRLSVGVHPEHAINSKINDLAEHLCNLGMDDQVVAIGETGLDYYYFTNVERSEIEKAKKLQQELFIEHIYVAKKLNKPLIIHTRMASQDTIAILNYYNRDSRGVIHCFTENWETAKNALDLGFYISFSGIITFNSKVAEILEVVKKVPLERMLIETDSPFLAPVPYRGKINRPSYVIYVAKKIAELKNITLEEVAAITTQNYLSLFKINTLVT